MRRADIVTAVIILPLWLLLVLVVIPATVGEGDDGSLQPSFMPNLVVIAGLLLMTGMLFHRLFAAVKLHHDEPPMPFESWVFLSGAIVVFSLGFYLIAAWGYLIGGPVIVGGFMILARARWVQLAVTSIVTPLALWAIFWHVLGIPLP